MPFLTRFPGQSYSGGSEMLTQDSNTFLLQVESWRTKRERGSTCRMTSGTWEQQMNIFEDFFAGMTVEEMNAWFEAYCSDVDGKPLFGTSTNEADIAKYNAFSAEERAAMDAVTGASMSLRSDNGDLLSLIEKAWSTAKDTNITVLR